MKHRGPPNPRPQCKPRPHAHNNLCGFCGRDENADHNGCLQILSTGKQTPHSNSNEFIFKIPRQLPGLNEIIDWSKHELRYLRRGKRRVFRYTLKKSEYEATISKFALAARTSDFKPFKSAKIDFIWIEPNRRRDPSNVCAGGRKFILDALVKSGILSNDNWLIHNFTDEFMIDKLSPGIIVKICEE